VHFCSVCY